MKLDGFKLEVYFSQYEFTAPYLLCCSDCEAMTVSDLLAFEPGAQEAFMDTWLGYSESVGDPEVLALIAKLYKTAGVSDILEHVGAQEAIFNFQNAVLNPGDHVIAMFPNYESSYAVAKKIGCSLSYWRLRQTNNGWALDLDELKGLIRPNTKVIMLNTPNNPTGYRLSPEEAQAITELARKQGIIVFADEVYRGLNFVGEEAPAFVDLYEDAVSLNVLSKAFGLAGLRLGWIATRNKGIRKAMELHKHYTTICGPKPSQFLAAVALKHWEALLKRNETIIRENLALADAFFDRHADVFLHNRPMGGSIGFHKLKSGAPIRAFCQDLVDKKGVLLLPGDVYDIDEPYFRLGYGRSNFAEALGRLAEYAEEEMG